jgi:hypothetical protein
MASITEEIPRLAASWTGQAAPVVVSGGELDEVDDLSAGIRLFTGPEEPSAARASWDSLVADKALLAVIFLVAILPVAFAFALATP